MKNNIDIYMHMIAMMLILVFTMFYAILVIIHPSIYTVLKMVAIIVIICCIYIFSNRNTYLPFLGSTVLPPVLFLQDIAPQGSNDTFILNLNNVDNGTRVIYWGALPKEKSVIGVTHLEAYGDYANTGITTVKDNKATLLFNCPNEYNTGLFNKKGEKHIHYRLIKPDNPMMSQVFTTYVNC